jgi:hypothetical protein
MGRFLWGYWCGTRLYRRISVRGGFLFCGTPGGCTYLCSFHRCSRSGLPLSADGIVEGMRSEGVLAAAAIRVSSRAHSLRMLALVLVGWCFSHPCW